MKAKTKPLFTILIANYNHGKFLGEAIKSIINQNYQNYELFIVDANSTDKSLDVIKSFDTKIDWWVSEKDSGQSEAFNKGFRKANGTYLFWLNADDILLPNSLQKATEYVNRNPKVNWISANTIFFDVNNVITKCTNGPNWNDYLFDKGPITVYGPTTIFKKSIFDEVGGFDEMLHYTMDTDLWFKFKNKGYKFDKIHEYFWGFRIHSDSKTSHAYNEAPSDKFLCEANNIKIKNNIIHTKNALFFQKIFKILNGNYMKSFIDTKKYKGKIISNIII